MTKAEVIEYIRSNLKEKGGTLPLDVRGALLFGSWVRGEQSPDSDIDLLVVAENINPKRHRRGEEIAQIKRYLPGLPLDILLLTKDEVVSNFINHNPLFLDIAEDGIIIFDDGNFLHDLVAETRDYVRKRKIRRFGDGWIFPVEKGRATFLSRVSNKDFAQVMLEDGKRDLEIGENLAKQGYWDKAVYHSQQSIEKSIKSILIAMGIFQKTHLVGGVLRKVISERKDIEKWEKDLTEIADLSEGLEPAVSLSRYPGVIEGSLWIPSQEYDNDDANDALAKAHQVSSVAARFYKEWFP